MSQVSHLMAFFYPHRDKHFGFVLSSMELHLAKMNEYYLGHQLPRHYLTHHLAAPSYTTHTWGSGLSQHHHPCSSHTHNHLTAHLGFS